MRKREHMDKRILFIGGSPCSGKSTVAERIAKKYGAFYFKVDDFLEQFMKRAAQRGYPVCKKCMEMTPDETWMREPSIQCEEEFLVYDEIAEFVFERLKETDADLIVTEGAAYTPQVMGQYGADDYISIVPTPAFQISHYREREWVPYILRDCADQEKAFDNWMKRDILFAEKVKAECENRKIPCLVNDGTRTEEEMFATVEKLFALTGF